MMGLTEHKKNGNIGPTEIMNTADDQYREKPPTMSIGLKPKITLFNGISIIVGVIVGSGIFVSPKGVLMHTGNAFAALLVWLFCGMFCLLGALCYAELGTMIPKSGGGYSYIYEAFGKIPAFLFLWISLIIINPTSITVMALTFANYAVQPLYPHCDPPEFMLRAIASSVIVVLTTINCYKVRWATRIQDYSTIAKVVALLVISVAGFVYLAMGNVQHFKEAANSSISISVPRLSLAILQGVFSYSGFNYLNFVAEEIKEPYKNLPRAIYISLPVVAIIYMLVNCSYFAVLSTDEILESPAVAFTFADRLFGPIKHIMPLFVAISCIGSTNGIILTSSRMFLVGARDGQLPELLAMISIKYMTPVPSLLILCLLSVTMLYFADVLVLINYVSFSEFSTISMTILALVKMRVSNPDLPHPIKFNIAIPLSFFGLCLCVLIASLIMSPYELIAAITIILTGVPVYLLFVLWDNKPRIVYTPWVKFTHSVQKLLLCVTEDESNRLR